MDDQQSPPPEPVTDSPSNQRVMAMFAHVSAILAAVITGTLGGFIGPLIIWLIYRTKDGFVEDQAKEALNFQITIMFLYLIIYIVVFGLPGRQYVLLAVPFLLQVIMGIVAGVNAYAGQRFRYPFILRLIK